MSSAPPTSTLSLSLPATSSPALPPLEPDQLELVGLVRKLGARLVIAHDATNKALTLLDDLLHLFLDLPQVLGSKGSNRIEVVVEAVGDGGANAELRLGIDALNRLREHVRRRVAQNVQAVRAVDRNGLNGVCICHFCREVAQFAVHAHCDDRTVGEQAETICHGSTPYELIDPLILAGAWLRVESRTMTSHRTRVIAAWSVHAFTLTGVIWATLAMLALFADQPKLMWLYLGIALIVDGVDGTLARRADVKTYAPNFDGVILDCVVDYLTWTFIPALFMYRGLLGEGAIAVVLLALINVTSMFCYANTKMKTDDYYFMGFPATWNIVALALWLMAAHPLVNAILVVFFSVLTLGADHVRAPVPRLPSSWRSTSSRRLHGWCRLACWWRTTHSTGRSLCGPVSGL